MSVKIFVRNLHPDTTGQQLSRFFATACTVLSAEVPRDWETGQSLGYGFVEFPSEEEAERALTVFDGRWFGRRALQLERARKDGPSRMGHRIPSKANREPVEAAGEALGTYADTLDGERELFAQGRKLRRGKHGSDRRRRQGTRRWIE